LASCSLRVFILASCSLRVFILVWSGLLRVFIPVWSCLDWSCAHRKDNKTLYLIKTSMNWTQAQSYCRYHHTDLASGLDQVDGEEMKALFIGGHMSVWMGLFRDSWRWSDGSNSSFRYWDMQLFNDEQSNKKCAMTLLNRSGKWSSDECDKEKPFFCYDGEFLSTCV
uniref:C-type lectin domain-containing protein n=1 Tax=Maylandia zebra TaxID=106582 RepID=A0A3P9DHM4_9CICH